MQNPLSRRILHGKTMIVYTMYMNNSKNNFVLVCIVGLILIFIGGYFYQKNRTSNTVNQLANLSGNVMYKERIALPSGSKLEVTLLDTVSTDAQSAVIASSTIITNGENVPLPFTLSYDTKRINESMSYSVRAQIFVGGTLKWTTLTDIPVLTRNNPTTTVEVPVVRVPGTSVIAPPPTKSMISGTEWSWKETKMMNGSYIRPQQSEQFVIRFNVDKTFTSTTDCNDLIGSFVANREVISIGPIASTKRMCIAATQESEYTQQLGRATSFSIVGNELTINLMKGSGTMVFTKHTKETSTKPIETLVLDGKKFVLSAFNGIEIPSQQKYSLSFENGSLSARFCNGLGGAYTVIDGIIESKQMVGTLMYCEQPSNIMELEQTFGTVMSGGAQVQLVGNTLTITGIQGKIFSYSIVQ